MERSVLVTEMSLSTPRMLILDVVDETIAAIEVLYRDDVRKRLEAVMP